MLMAARTSSLPSVKIKSLSTCPPPMSEDMIVTKHMHESMNNSDISVNIILALIIVMNNNVHKATNFEK